DVPAPFDPPVPIFPRTDWTRFQMLFRNLARPFRRCERHRFAEITRSEKNAAPLRLQISRFGRERFAMLGARLVADTKFRARFQAQTTVARAIAKQLGSNAVNMFGAITARLHALNHPVF